MLSPDWREGMTWTLEVRGSLADDRWTVSFWGISHFVVESVTDHRASVTVRFHPIDVPSLDDPACSSRLEFERRPWRLARVELEDAAGARVLTPEDPVTAFGMSPCLPPVPRHPHAAAGPTPETRQPQRVAVRDGEVVFTSVLEDARYRGPWRPGVLRWRAGAPWWNKSETLDGDGLSVFGRTPDGPRSGYRLRDQFLVERARLIAIDGQAVRAARWTTAAPQSRFFERDPDGHGLPPDGLTVSEAP